MPLLQLSLDQQSHQRQQQQKQQEQQQQLLQQQQQQQQQEQHCHVLYTGFLGVCRIYCCPLSHTHTVNFKYLCTLLMWSPPPTIGRAHEHCTMGPFAHVLIQQHRKFKYVSTQY